MTVNAVQKHTSPLTSRETTNAIEHGLDGPLPRHRVAVWVDEEEADAFLTLLLHAPETGMVAAEVADRLLCRIADAQRELDRRAAAACDGG